MAATVVYLVGAGAVGQRVRLQGPGVEGSLSTRLPLSRRDLAERQDACASFPLGIDLIFVHRDGKVSGLPRSTKVEPR